MDVTRRNLIQILGIAPAAAAAQTQAEHTHAEPPAPGKTAYQRKVFDDHQWRTVQVLCDLIIPADEQSGSATPPAFPSSSTTGSTSARTKTATRTSARESRRAGLAGPGIAAPLSEGFRRGRAGAAEADSGPHRLARARAAADRRWAAFFTRFRDLTVSGFFSSKMGVADLPYLGNKAVAEWKGCDPKVWAVIEERMKNGYKGLGGEVKPWE